MLLRRLSLILLNCCILDSLYLSITLWDDGIFNPNNVWILGHLSLDFFSFLDADIIFWFFGTTHAQFTPFPSFTFQNSCNQKKTIVNKIVRIRYHLSWWIQCLVDAFCHKGGIFINFARASCLRNITIKDKLSVLF